MTSLSLTSTMAALTAAGPGASLSVEHWRGLSKKAILSPECNNSLIVGALGTAQLSPEEARIWSQIVPKKKYSIRDIANMIVGGKPVQDVPIERPQQRDPFPWLDEPPTFLRAPPPRPPSLVGPQSNRQEKPDTNYYNYVRAILHFADGESLKQFTIPRFPDCQKIKIRTFDYFADPRGWLNIDVEYIFEFWEIEANGYYHFTEI